jgi:hypothetical protein
MVWADLFIVKIRWTWMRGCLETQWRLFDGWNIGFNLLKCVETIRVTLIGYLGVTPRG